jgi:hypothetical protein
MPLDNLLTDQTAWAKRRWPGHVGPRAPSLDDNLTVRSQSRRDVSSRREVAVNSVVTESPAK